MGVYSAILAGFNFVFFFVVKGRKGVFFYFFKKLYY